MKKTFIIIALSVFHINNLLQASLVDGLVAYYPFNGNAIDQSGSGNHGIVEGAALTSDRNGIAKSAYVFNGVNSRIRVPDSSSLHISTNCTISAWFYQRSANAPNVNYSVRIIDKNSIGIGNGFDLCAGGLNDKRVSCDIPQGLISDRSCEFDRWHQLTVTVNGNEGIMYLDGLVVARSSSMSLPANSLPLIIGANQNMPSYNCFYGSIDDVLIYNRSLSASEVANLVALGTPMNIPITLATQIPASDLTALVPSSSTQLAVYSGGSFVTGGSVDVNQPTFVITHGWNPLGSTEIPDWVTTLAASLHAASPDANIVAWNWQSQAKGYLSKALSRTSEQGAGLGKALTETLGASYFRNVHFLGHSLGTIVNARAAETLHAGTSASKIQMTLFDDAEVGNLNLIGGDEESWKRPIPAGNIVSRVDNYITSFGNPRAEATNVILRKSMPETWTAFHGEAQLWYAQTANKSSLPEQTGIHGSIIVNDSNSSYVDKYYYCQNDWNLSVISDYNTAIEFVKARDFLFSTSPEGIGVGAATVSVQGVITVSKLTQSLIAASIRGSQYFTGTLIPELNAAAQEVSENRILFRAEKHSPSYGWVPVVIPAGATGLSFDFKFSNVSANDSLSFAIDDQLLFGIEAKYAGNLSENNSGYIDVSQWSGTTANIFIGLNSSDENNVGGDVTVGNIQFYAKAAFDSWTAVKGLSSTDAATTADPDKDGTPNLLEYAFGQEPTSPDHSGIPIGGVQNIDGANYLTLSYRKPKSVPDLMYAVEVSSDLVHWTTETTQFSAVDNGDNTETITFKDNSPQSNSSRRFMRVKVTH